MSITNVNNYIKFKVLEYEYFKLINNNLQEQYQEDFTDFMEAIFKAYNPTTIYNLQTLLRHQGIEVKRDKHVTIIQFLYNIIYKKD